MTRLTIIIAIGSLLSCGSPIDNHEVSVAEFAEFVEATDYVTHAEVYGWSPVMRNVYEFDLVLGANWKKPDGFNLAHPDHPVTQVSYSDACAYCKWKGKRLPNFDEWVKAADWDDKGHHNAFSPIPANETKSMRGNVWEWVGPQKSGFALRVGGSYLCQATTCAGYELGNAKMLSIDSGANNLGFRCAK
jgi:formylglycine-generating enzyme required for sulfatase activity